MQAQEFYHAVVIGVNATFTMPDNGYAAAMFVATSTGTLTITTRTGIVKLNAFPVTAGNCYPLRMIIGGGATVTTAGGASGTLDYSA